MCAICGDVGDHQPDSAAPLCRAGRHGAPAFVDDGFRCHTRLPAGLISAGNRTDAGGVRSGEPPGQSRGSAGEGPPGAGQGPDRRMPTTSPRGDDGVRVGRQALFRPPLSGDAAAAGLTWRVVSSTGGRSPSLRHFQQIENATWATFAAEEAAESGNPVQFE